ncbi:MAG: arginase family protein [Bacteroidetes bacterium]|nr:arginase family protein [Bacteroidota bacterium]
MFLFSQDHPDWKGADILLIGCPDQPEGNPKGSSFKGVDKIRDQLYQLSIPGKSSRVMDMGNLKPKTSSEAFYEMMAYVLGVIFEEGKTVILLGGSQDMVYGQYMAYENLEKSIEYVHIDSRFDAADSDITLDRYSFNHKIFVHQPNYLFNYTNLGYQSYFVSDGQRKTLKDLDFLVIRYGELHQRIEEAEPALRTADMVSFDLSAIRSSECTGVVTPSPGGFSAIEACRLARYAGLGYGISSFSISEFLWQKDVRDQSALLASMLVWYFVDGFYSKREDYPAQDRSNLRKYAVRLHASIEAINFFEHPTTGRWWMEVPFQKEIGKKKPKTVLVPCSKKDYEFAKTDDIPERWWMVYNKLK